MSTLVLNALEPVDSATPETRLERWLWAGLLTVTILCIALHLGPVLNYLYPLMTFGMAMILEKRSPKGYVRLLILLLMFTPFIRRLSDWTSTYTDPSPMLVAPLLAPFAGLRSIRPSELLRRQSLPFILAGVGIFYGLAVALISNPPSTSMAVSFLRWINPLAWGLYLVQRNDDKVEVSRTLVQTLKWAALVCAAYGLVQVMFTLPWDTAWLKSQLENGSLASFGTDSSAFGFRLFATLNSCGVAAPILGIGALTWVGAKGVWRYPALAVIVFALFFTMVRTEWICLPVCIVLMLALSVGHRAAILQVLIVTAVALLVGGSLFAATRPDAMGKLVDRVAGVGQGMHDDSFSSRTEAMEEGATMLLQMPSGAGLGFLDSPQYDSTPMSFAAGAAGGDLALVGMFFDLGFIGAMAYSAGVVLVLVSMFRHRRRDIATAAVLISISVSTVLHFWSNIPFVAPEAFFFWASAAAVYGL